MTGHNFTHIKRQLSIRQGAVFFFVIASFFAVFLLISLNAFAAVPDDLSFVLKQIKDKISNNLGQTDKELFGVARDLSSAGIDTFEARIILRKFLKAQRWALDCATLDLSGRMVLVEPRIYKGFEGTDISKQEHIVLLYDTKKPVFSKMFPSAENCDTISFAYPVFSASGEFIGAVSLLIRPQFLIEPIIMSIVKRSAIEVWVMQPDGLMVYNQDVAEIGKNVFKDDIYKTFPGFVSLCEKIAQEENGSGSYLTKDAVWDTVSINGLKWRIVAALEKQ